MNKRRYIGYFYLAAAMSLAGSSVVVGKHLSHLPIFLLQTVALIFALLFIIPIAMIKEGMPKLRQIPIKDYILMLMQGLFGVLMFRIFMMLALRYASAASTGIALSTTPAVLAIFSVIFLKERISIKSAVAVFLCFAGMSLLNFDFANFSLKMDKGFILGNLFALMSVCSEAMFTIFRKKQSYSDRPLTSTAIVMFFAFVLFLPVGGYQYIVSGFDIAFSLNNFIWIFIYGSACSSIAYAFWFSGLCRVEINEAAGFTGFMPLASVVLSVVILHERIAAGHIIGMALVLLGIYVIILKKEEKLKNEKVTGDLAN